MRNKILIIFIGFVILLSGLSWWFISAKLEESPNKQMVVVVAKGSKADVFFIETIDEFKIKKYQGFVGKNGIIKNKIEGDGCTPKGKFDLDYAFGMERIDGNFMYIDITDESYYVTDVMSPLYNSWSEGIEDFEQAEKLSDYEEEYKYAVVIGYNKERLAGKGSAIFLHCSMDKPTAGCVAINEEDLKEIISRLDNDENPCIIIIESLIELFDYL